MNKNDAVKYVKKDFTKFGKLLRELAGQKLALKSDNNYYANEWSKDSSNSTRRLDVNTLQSLIFNNIKYVLK